MDGARLRQVALVARELDPVIRQLQAVLGLAEPYRDPIVEEFGLENAVFVVGDTFLEVVAPIRPGTAAGRHLDRHGGDTGYMAIFQVDDLEATRRRIDRLGIRVVWTATFPDLVGMHLHPRDVPGAIVSLDWADPPTSWRWGGPAWTATAPTTAGGGLTGVTVAVADPEVAAARWSDVLGAPIDPATPTIRLDRDQAVRFVRSSGPDGIREVTLVRPDGPPVDATVGGVRFVAEVG